MSPSASGSPSLPSAIDESWGSSSQSHLIKGIRRTNASEMSTLTFSCNCLANDAANGLVETKHIQKYATNLGQVKATDGGTRRNIGFQHIREDFDVIKVAQHVDVLCGLGHQR